MTRRAFSLVEVIISIFLLGGVAMGVLSMTQTAFVAQRRSENLLQAGLLAQQTMNEVRAWAEDPDHFLGDWSSQNGRQFNSGTYQVTITCRPEGRRLDSPCQSLEAQWEGTPQGTRSMPRAVVPLEVRVAWSPLEKDSLKLTSLIGEPQRDLTGARVVVSDPNPSAIANGDGCLYSAEVFDAAGRPFQNLLFGWSADRRYVSVLRRRDGRQCEVVRDRTLTPLIPPPPSVLPVQCFASYAGVPLPVISKGVGMP